MKKICVLIFVVAFLFGAAEVRAAPPISAECAVVIDADSGRVMFEKNAYSAHGMASTTKIITAIVALESGDLNSVARVSAKTAAVEGSSMYLEENEEITLENLLYGLMLVSGNDAATAIAEHISGSEEKFVELMNKKAAEIGALNTHLENPHGLSSDTHYTTAYDLAKITAYALKNSKFAEIVSTKTKNITSSDGSVRTLNNHNRFLRIYDGCIGVKTGFTKATGRCLVTAVKKSDMTLVCVTLCDPNDWDDHKALYDYVFDKYAPKPVASAGQSFGAASVGHGVLPETQAVLAEDFLLPVAEEEVERVTLTAELSSGLEAPVAAGDRVGTLTATLDGAVIGEVPLTASSEVLREEAAETDNVEPEGGYKAAFLDIVLLWLTRFSA